MDSYNLPSYSFVGLCVLDWCIVLSLVLLETEHIEFLAWYVTVVYLTYKCMHIALEFKASINILGTFIGIFGELKYFYFMIPS